MTNQIIVPAEIREDAGKGASRRLRHTGKVPAILYGGDKAPVALALDHNWLWHAAAQEAFNSSVLSLKVGRKSQKVVLRDMQTHPYKQQIMHVDFQRIDEKQGVRIAVPLHFMNEESSPASKQAGVVISHNMTEVEVFALPKDLPEYIEVDLAGLEPGGLVMLSELPLPEGVAIPALEAEGETDAQVVSTIYIRATQGTGALAAEADAALAEGAEPEVGEPTEAQAEGESEAEADADAEGQEKGGE